MEGLVTIGRTLGLTPSEGNMGHSARTLCGSLAPQENIAGNQPI